MSYENIQWACYGWIGLAAIIHILMFNIKAPFGRHTTSSWGPSMDNKWGWFVMELPSLLIMCLFLVAGTKSLIGYTWLLFSCWIFHYFNRTIVYPARIKATEKKIPVAIVCSAIFFNLVNAGLNGYFLAELAPPENYAADKMSDLRMIAGFSLFITGMFINWRSDNILINLRSNGETGYKIPQGFLFRYISCPNLFGEILEWAGFAVMAWNLPALTFLAWTYANLVPRAKNHHDWYHANFSDYPKKRKIVFPFIY
jgi:3-oxo-5-alpha-steroid 4-dehydrogenase 1